MFNMSILEAFLGVGMVATSLFVLAPAPTSGLCLYWRRFGLGDSGYLPLGAGAGADVRVDQAEVGTPL